MSETKLQLFTPRTILDIHCPNAWSRVCSSSSLTGPLPFSFMEPPPGQSQPHCPLTPCPPHPQCPIVLCRRVYTGVLFLLDSFQLRLSKPRASHKHCYNPYPRLPWWLSGKESACQCRRQGSIPGLERSPGEGNGNLLEYFRLENPMNGGAWWATVAKNQTQMND